MAKPFEAGAEYIWVQPKNAKGYWRKVGAGKGTHKAAKGYVSKSGKQVGPYLQKRDTIIRPHVRVVAPYGKKGYRTQRVRGSVRGDATVDTGLQTRYHRRFFTEKAVKKTQRAKGSTMKDPWRLPEWREAAGRQKMFGDAFARQGHTDIIQGGYKRSRAHINLHGNPNRQIMGEAQLAEILKDEEIMHLEAGMEGAFDAGLELMEIANERIPRDTEYMANTAFVSAVDDGVILGYGAHYAIYQHENLSYKHDIGEAKWLEKTVAENHELAVGHIYNGMRRLYGAHEFGPEGAMGNSTYGAAPWRQFGNPDEGFFSPQHLEKMNIDLDLTPKSPGVRTRRTTSRRFREEMGF